MILLCSAAGFVCVVCSTKLAPSRFLNALSPFRSFIQMLSVGGGRGTLSIMGNVVDESSSSEGTCEVCDTSCSAVYVNDVFAV